jgi:hypothetical protein
MPSKSSLSSSLVFIRGNSNTFRVSSLVTSPRPSRALFSVGKPLPVGAEDWPFSVGVHHPSLAQKGPTGKPNYQPLVPIFEKSGKQEWPMAKRLRKARGKTQNRDPRLGIVNAAVEPTTVVTVGADTYAVTVT